MTVHGPSTRRPLTVHLQRGGRPPKLGGRDYFLVPMSISTLKVPISAPLKVPVRASVDAPVLQPSVQCVRVCIDKSHKWATSIGWRAHEYLTFGSAHQCTFESACARICGASACARIRAQTKTMPAPFMQAPDDSATLDDDAYAFFGPGASIDILPTFDVIELCAFCIAPSWTEHVHTINREHAQDQTG